MLTVLLVLVALAVGLLLGWMAALAHSSRVAGTLESLSARALKESNAEFLAQADARLSPVREALGAVDRQLRDVEASRQRAYGGLVEQVSEMRGAHEALRRETGMLVTALRAPQTRGRWGEMTLRRVVEAAGAVEHCHFSEQVTTDSDAGRQRPDLVVHLADGKHVVVDSKVPFDAYLRAAEARDDTERASWRRAHAKALREHVHDLGSKAYWRALDGTPELVVLFVPADAFLDAALQEDPTLLDDAFGRDVVLATPSTLVALLRTVAYCWRSEALAANAGAISAVGRELYDRLATLGGHVDRLGVALGRAVGAYNAAVGTLESRVLVSARRLADLDVSSTVLTTPEAVIEVPRPLTAPEWLNDDGAARHADEPQGAA